MTIEEAVRCIEDVLNSDYHYDESLGYQLTSDDFEWLETAKEVLEKQIPKKIIERTEADREYIDYCCPACKVILEQKLKSVKFPLANRDSTAKTFKYCYDCGQRLDWSDLK